MKQAKWIWNYGDFELYHCMLLTNRRTASGIMRPPMWRVDSPSCNLYAYKVADIDKDETVTLYSNSEKACLSINNTLYKAGDTVSIHAGHYDVRVYVYNKNSFPAAYCIGDTFASDETWLTHVWDGNDKHAGTNNMYNDANDNPEIFKFSYERIFPVTSQSVNGGILYDFGCEKFGKIILENTKSESENFTLYCGESREEALDLQNAVINIAVNLKSGYFKGESVAFRFVFIPDDNIKADVSADFEYIPLDNKGSFECDDELINKVWSIASYTMHLNSREAFFDGVKRDRWVWSGDAYQSAYVNYYLMNDNDIVRRTALMLRGAEPMTCHINTIPDYTFYWIIGIWEYYFYSGDIKFISDIYGKMCSAMSFVKQRLDKDGLYTVRNSDWMFIDWSNFDKDSGPLCAEQMLLCRAYECMAKCADLAGYAKDAAEYAKSAENIRRIINERYWDVEKFAYIDDYKTGNRSVTRHANIFALLFNIASKGRQQNIIENVIKNDNVVRITTPYFEFFELDAMCNIGDFDYMTDMLRSYWGGMVKLGATTFWEEYDPKLSGLEHYMMYGGKYEKSLCHAWSSSPIYLLGKYSLGVYPTAPGYVEYVVKPCLMGFKFIKGSVPTPNGNVNVEMNESYVKINSECAGGTLILDGKSYKIEQNKELTLKR